MKRFIVVLAIGCLASAASTCAGGPGSGEGEGTIVVERASWLAAPPYYWKAVPAAGGDDASEARTRDESVSVAPGDYRVVWRQTEHAHPDVPVSRPVSVAADDTVVVRIETGVRIETAEGTEPPYRIHFVHGDSGEEFVWHAGFHDRWEPVVLPAGTYELVWHQDEHGAPPVELGTVAVAAGRLNEVVVNSGFRLEPAEWVDSPYRFSLIDDRRGHAYRWYGGFGTPLAAQIAPPGTYRLVYHQTEHGHDPVEWGEVRIEPGEITVVPIRTGVRFDPPAGRAPPYRVYFRDLETGREFAWRAGFLERWEPVPLPAGLYGLDWRERQRPPDRATLRDSLRVPPDSLVALETP